MGAPPGLLTPLLRLHLPLLTGFNPVVAAPLLKLLLCSTGTVTTAGTASLFLSPSLLSLPHALLSRRCRRSDVPPFQCSPTADVPGRTCSTRLSREVLQIALQCRDPTGEVDVVDWNRPGSGPYFQAVRDCGDTLPAAGLAMPKWRILADTGSCEGECSLSRQPRHAKKLRGLGKERVPSRGSPCMQRSWEA